MQRGHRIALVLIAVVVAVAGVLLIGQGDTDDDAEPVATTEETRPDGEPTATVRGPKPKPSFQTLRVVGGKPRGGVSRIRVEKGDVVRLAVRSDSPAEVHVHGYELLREVRAGGTARFRFKASIEGVFEIELEETHTQIAELVVEP